MGRQYFSDSRSEIVQLLIGCKTTKRHFEIFNGLLLSQLTFTTALCLFLESDLKLCRDKVLEAITLCKVFTCDVTKGTDHLSVNFWIQHFKCVFFVSIALGLSIFLKSHLSGDQQSQLLILIIDCYVNYASFSQQVPAEPLHHLNQHVGGAGSLFLSRVNKKLFSSSRERLTHGASTPGHQKNDITPR